MVLKKMKLVMVGNGMAGVRTLEELLKLAPDLYDITVFGAEPHPNYNRILLSPVLAGEQTVDDIVLNSREWYAENGITLHAGKTVTTIDRVKRKVIADDGTEADYDRLLLATGARAQRPPLPGSSLPGAMVLSSKWPLRMAAPAGLGALALGQLLPPAVAEAARAAAQLAHHLGLPVYNSSGLTDSKLPDAQAGYESATTLSAVR